MIIERLDLKAFGRFTDFSLDLSAGPNRFHIVYGPNESGKSTSLRAINSLLYGMPNRTSDNYLHDNPKMRVGGRLVDESGGVLECVRRRGRKDTLRDGDDANPVGETQLQRLLSGVDRETFEQRFGLSHDELVSGGAQIVNGGGDLGSILFAASAGVSALRDVQAELDKSCASLFLARGKNASINRHTTTLAQQRQALRDAQVLPDDFAERKRRLDDKNTEARHLHDQIKSIARELAGLNSMHKAMPLIPKWESTRSELEELNEVPDLDDAFTQRRRNVDTERQVAMRKQSELRRQLEHLRDQLNVHPASSPLIQNELQIEHLLQQLGARHEANSDRIELIRKRDNVNRRMHELLGDLNVNVIAADEVSLSEAIDAAVAKLRVGESVQTRVHELARKHERLMQQRDDAEEDVQSLSHKLDRIAEELEMLDAAVSPDAINQLIDSISHPDALLDSLADQIANEERAKRACEVTHRRLVGLEMPFVQAAKLKLPSDTAIQDAAGEMQNGAEQLARVSENLQQLIDQQTEVKRRLQADASAQPLPTLSDLADARAERDRLVAAADQSDLSTIDSLRLAIIQADQLSDTIRLHHEQVHRRSIDTALLESLDQEISQGQSKIDSLQQASESAYEQWRSIWQSIGVTADTPERMRQWVADHGQLVQRVDHWNEERGRKLEIEQRVIQTCERLRSVIRSVAAQAVAVAVETHDQTSDATLFSQEDSQIDLRSLYDEAVLVRRRLNEDKAKRGELESRRAEVRQELAEAQSRLQTRQRHFDSWNTEWAQATDAFVNSSDSTPTVVVGMLSQIQKLADQTRERNILAKRIQSIADDENAYRSDVEKLAKAMKLTFDSDSDVHEYVRDLFQQLRDDRELVTKRSAIEQQIRDAESELADAIASQSQCDIAVQQLCSEAQCDEFESLVEIERRARQRRELAAVLTNLEDQFQILAGSIKVEDLIAKTREQDPTVLELDIEQTEGKLADLNEALAETQREVGALRNELDRVDGGTKAAEISQSIQAISGDLMRDAEEYARQKIASMILRRAIEHYRNANQGPVLELARQIFSQLTCGEYQSLRVDFDDNGKQTLMGVLSGSEGSSDRVVPANVMSTGTADTLYLAIRLASLRHHLSQGSKIPLIVDDCLVQLDDDRAVAALSAFSHLSTQTQVILFTHHRHLVELAETHLTDGEFHVHELSC